MAHPGTPDPAEIARTHRELIRALRSRPLTGDQRQALIAILQTLQSAQEVLTAASRRAVGGVDYPAAAGVLASVLDTYNAELAKLGQS